MTSPYDNNVGNNWGPPAGLSSMLAAQTQQGMEGMQAGAKAFDAAAAQFKQRQDEGKAADYLFKAHPEYLEQLGIHPEQFKTFGAVDKSRAAHAVMQDQTMRDMMAKRADLESQTNERNSIADWRQSQASKNDEEDAGAAAMMKELAGRGQPPALDPYSTTTNSFAPGAAPAWSPEVQAILESGANVSRMNPRMASTVLKEVLPQVMGTAGNKQFFKPGDAAKPVEGAEDWLTVPTGPNTSQLIYKGADVNKPVVQHDDDGNVLGVSQTDARGHSIFKPSKSDAKIVAATDDQGNVIPGYYRMGDKVIDARTAIQKMTGTAGSGGATDANAPKVGDVRKGYKFKGGDPKDPKSWEKQ